VRVRRRVISVTLVAVTAGILAACGPKAPPAAPAPPPAAPAAPAVTVDLKGATSYLASDLTRQLGPVRGRNLAIDPVLDKLTGQQTTASLQVQEALLIALASAAPDLPVQPLNSAAAPNGLVAAGVLSTTTPPDDYFVQVSFTDRVSGLVVAQSAARFRQPGLSGTPTDFYRDSPSLVRDRSVDGYVKTSETPAGSLADSLYVSQLPTAALLATALDEYNAGRWEGALTAYSAAASRQDGQTLRTFNGLYLTSMRLGRRQPAEDAFGKIVSLGLATNNLAVKLLFRPGTTDFLDDPNFSGVYPIWIRQIARGAVAAGVCLNVTGHTSASGTDAVNDPLSQQRANAVRALLVREVAALARNLRATGRGSRQTIVGTGADDASDAIDRRVEFEVEPCKPGLP
jgi:hypothetical protein